MYFLTSLMLMKLFQFKSSFLDLRIESQLLHCNLKEQSSAQAGSTETLVCVNYRHSDSGHPGSTLLQIGNVIAAFDQLP